MKSLLSNSVLSILNGWQEFSSAVKKITSQNDGTSFPIEINGLQGAAIPFFAAACLDSAKNAAFSRMQYETTGRYSNSAVNPAQKNIVKTNGSTSLDAVFVVPNEKDAAELSSDLATAFEENVEIFTLPWWGTVPYRAANVGSAVFGKRSAFLSKLAFQERKLSSSVKPRIFLVTQRALQSPVPPPDYLRSLIFSLHKNQQIDSTQIAEKLARLGYLRVPKVSVPGEFTLRGEVLDVFTPASYKEFGRILKKGGYILKVIPGSNHLKELRKAARDQLKNKDYSGEDVSEYFEQHYDIISRETLTNTMPIDQETLKTLTEMTPLLFDVDVSRLDLSEISEITVEAQLIIGRA